VGREPLADAVERDARHVRSARPKVDRRRFVRAFEELVSEIDLTIQLERPRLDRQRARGRPGLGRLVDDPQAHAELMEEQREHHAGGSRAGDQDVEGHSPYASAACDALASAGAAAIASYVSDT